jgi:hypothetical protein
LAGVQKNPWRRNPARQRARLWRSVSLPSDCVALQFGGDQAQMIAHRLRLAFGLHEQFGGEMGQGTVIGGLRGHPSASRFIVVIAFTMIAVAKIRA